MGLFDSKVYQRRNETPWAIMSLPAFMKEMAINGQAEVSFSCKYRPSVASRFWYTITWTDEQGTQHSASSQEWDLCLWRAAEIEIQTRRSIDGAQ